MNLNESTTKSSPARKDPKLPLRAQLSRLHENVPSGKPGRRLLYLFIRANLAKQPKGVNSKLHQYWNQQSLCIGRE